MFEIEPPLVVVLPGVTIQRAPMEQVTDCKTGQFPGGLSQRKTEKCTHALFLSHLGVDRTGIKTIKSRNFFKQKNVKII